MEELFFDRDWFPFFAKIQPCNLSDCNWTQTHNHFVHKQTLNYLAKLAKWLSVSTYLYDAFDRMFLSCHVRVCLNIKELFARQEHTVNSIKRRQYAVCNFLWKKIAPVVFYVAEGYSNCPRTPHLILTKLINKLIMRKIALFF